MVVDRFPGPGGTFDRITFVTHYWFDSTPSYGGMAGYAPVRDPSTTPPYAPWRLARRSGGTARRRLAARTDGTVHR